MIKPHNTKIKDRHQSDAFIKAARAAECDEDPKRFEERLKRVVQPRAVSPKKKPQRDKAM